MAALAFLPFATAFCLLAGRDGLLVELGDPLRGGVDAFGDGGGLGLRGHGGYLSGLGLEATALAS
jgi:hypothetical protein